MVRRLLTALLLATPAACIVVPLSRRDSPDTRQNIGEEVPAFIVAGATSRADVLLALGEPDGASDNGAQFVYTRGARLGGLFFAGCGYVTCAGGSTEKMAYDRLIIRFDDAGAVLGARHERVSCDESSQQRGPCVSLAGLDAAPAEPIRIPGAHVFPRATWYQGIRLGTFSSYPRSGIPGNLVVGESFLSFYSAGADTGSAPILAIPYGEIAHVGLAKNILLTSRAIVIQRASGTFESFAIGVDPRTQDSDSKENESAASLARSRWRAATLR